MLLGNLLSSQINDMTETRKRKNCCRLKTETYQPNAMCVDLVGILILNIEGYFF